MLVRKSAVLVSGRRKGEGGRGCEGCIAYSSMAKANRLADKGDGYVEWLRQGTFDQCRELRDDGACQQQGGG